MFEQRCGLQERLPKASYSKALENMVLICNTIVLQQTGRLEAKHKYSQGSCEPRTAVHDITGSLILGSSGPELHNMILTECKLTARIQVQIRRVINPRKELVFGCRVSSSFREVQEFLSSGTLRG